MQNVNLTNDQIMLAAGITQAQINAVKTADATTAANLLEAIHNKIISFIYSMSVEYANLSNQYSVFEKGYAAHNGGSLNGMFEEILVPTRAKGTNGLYGGRPYTPGQPLNPWDSDNIDFGADPLVRVYGINTKIERGLNWDMYDFLQALNEGSLGRYVAAKKATIAQEGYGSRYAIEGNVINCERFQAFDYADAPIHTNAAELNKYVHKVWSSQKYNEANTQFKRVPFNTTRGISRLFFILDEDFWFEFAQDFQISNFLKPFIYKSADIDTFGQEVTVEKTTVLVDKLTPTTLAANQILDPLNMTPATLPTGSKLVGRIVDWNAVKFGLGVTPTMEKQLDPCTWYHSEVHQACFDMSDCYVNVPILVSTDNFDAHRKFHIINDTPTPDPEEPAA